MRKQYHFRPSQVGLLAWDVHRLIELSAGLPIEQLSLTRIAELDEPYWFDDPEAPPTCRAVSEHAKLILEADTSYPIILSSTGRVMDGMHRVAKLLMQGESHVAAVQFPSDPPPDHIGVDPDDLPY